MFLDQVAFLNFNELSKKLSDKRIILGTVFCLLAIVHFFSLWRSSQPFENSLIVLMFYGAAIYFYYNDQQKLKFSNHLVPQLLGGIVSCLIALKITTLYQNEVKVAWALIAPLMVLSLVLLADGFRGIKSYWRVLFGITWISSISPAAEELLSKSTFLNAFSAQFSSFFLWYLGFDSRVESTFIYVNGGIVDVYAGCTALPFLILFLNLLIVLRLFCPSLIPGLSFYLIASLVISFPLSVVRIAIMALVVNDKPAFAYWHGTTGSNVFMIIALGCFWGVIFWKDFTNTANIQDNQITTDLPERKFQFSWSFTLFSSGLILILCFALLSPNGAANKISAYQFPANLNLSGWNFLSSEPLTPAEVSISEEALQAKKDQDSPLSPEQLLAIREAQKGSNIVMDGRRYFYENENEKLTVTLRYVINTFGNVGTYYGDDSPDRAMSKIFQEAERKVSPTKETVKFTDKNKTFLISCITPLENAVLGQDNFVDQRNKNITNILLNPVKLAEWFTGKTTFFDHRCLWTEIAIEPNSVANDQLDSVWKELKVYGQKNFPEL